MACVGKIRRKWFGNLEVGVPFPDLILSKFRTQRIASSLNNAIAPRRPRLINNKDIGRWVNLL